MNCGYCSLANPLFVCECKTVSYCGLKCQSKHWKNHYKLCGRITPNCFVDKLKNQPCNKKKPIKKK